MTNLTGRQRGCKPTSADHRGRRGVSVLVVLVVVALTMAMSYSVMRSQMTDMQVQFNSDRTNSAREAALAGINAGMRKMWQSDWGGVGSAVEDSVNATDSYSVTYTAGDPSLTPASSNYSDLPLRVTLLSTGTSIDPAHPSISTTYNVRAVMRLIPKKLNPPPANWSTVTSYTIYQLTSQKVSLAVPCHIEGPVRLQGGVDITSEYSWSDTAEARYYADLNVMRTGTNEVQTITRSGLLGGTFTLSLNGATTGNLAYNCSAATVQAALQNLSTIGSGNVSVTGSGSPLTITFIGQLAATNVPTLTVNTSNLAGILGFTFSCSTSTGGVAGIGDYRPFSGPINAPTTKTNSRDLGLLTSQLALTVNNIAVATSLYPPVCDPGSYQLYPGGPVYNVTMVPSTLSNTTLTPDPATNPLGLFSNWGSITIGNNVTINGTLNCSGDINITGSNVKWLPYNLPSLDGDSSPVRLPALWTSGNLHVSSTAKATINGFMYIANKLLVDQGPESSSLSITGNVIVANDVTVAGRNEWKAYGGGSWDTYYTLFGIQTSMTNGIQTWPQWLSSALGRSYLPIVKIQPDNTPQVREWHDFSYPLYVIPDTDSGLHWDLVSWTDHA